MIQIIPVPGLPEVASGDDLALLISSAADSGRIAMRDGDIVVIAQKVVSKSEGRTVRLDSITPSARAEEWAGLFGKDPRLIEVVLRNSVRVIRMEQGVIISETEHGFVCANAGVDASNVTEGTVTLLPVDSDASARRIRTGIRNRLGASVAVIVADTFGRPWREGLTNVALGVAGIAPLVDYRGRNDWHGRPLRATAIAVADELASAAELVMKKDAGVPMAIVRGYEYEPADSSVRKLIRAAENDLFR
jgi:coenzyme F420-0:L-glutamate ligase/coenzyme F420-1:gamma-L-glutamate ligase